MKLLGYEVNVMKVAFTVMAVIVILLLVGSVGEMLSAAKTGLGVRQLNGTDADQELEAQRIRNTKKREMAETERYSAQEFAKAEKSAVQIRELEIRKLQAEALKIAAGKWQGEYGSIMPQGASVLFGLDVPQATK